MAQLTWKNVDAPNFNDVNYALANAGEQMNRGFQAARQAIDGYQKDQTQAVSAQAMTAAMGVKDPNQLASILAQFNPSYLSPEALRFAGSRPQDLATLAQTQAQTAGTNIANSFAQAANPIRLQDMNLGVATKAEGLKQNIWTNQVTRDEYAAREPFNQEINTLRAQLSSGNPEQRALATARLGSPEFAKMANAAGVKDVATFAQGLTATGLAGGKATADFEKQDQDTKNRAFQRESEERFAWVRQSMATPTAAKRMVQNSTWHPTVQENVLKLIEGSTGSWPTGPSSPAEVLSMPVPPKAAPTQGGQAFNINPLLEAVRAGGDVVTSATRPVDHNLSQKNPNSAHIRGLAYDLRARTPQEADAVMARQRTLMESRGLVEGQDFRIKDEVRNPVPYATGPHIHVELTPVGAAKLNGGTAPPGMGSAARVTAMLDQARTPPVPFQFSGLQPPPQAVAAEAADPNQDVRSLLASVTNVSQALQNAADTSQIDASFGAEAPLVDALINRPNATLPAQQVALKVYEKIGKPSAESDGFFRNKNVDLNDIVSEIKMLEKQYGMAPDVAGAFVQSAIVPTFNWGVGDPDGLKVDRRKLADNIKKFIDMEGPNKGQIKPTYVEVFRQKANIQEQVKQGRQLLEDAQKEYLAAVQAQRRGNSSVDVEGPKRRLEEAMNYLKTSPVFANPASRALTGSKLRQ